MDDARLNESLRVLLVEDSEDDAALLLTELGRSGFEVIASRVETAAEMAAALDAHEWNMVVSDFNLPNFSGPAALELLKSRQGDIPFLLVSGAVGEEAAVEALREGAADFIMKGNYARLVPAIRRELAEAEHRASRRRAEASWIESERRFETAFQANPAAMIMVGASGRIMEVNDSFLSLFGWSREDIVGGQARDLRQWADTSEFQRFSTQLAQYGCVSRLEVALRTSEGAKKTGLLSAERVALKDEECLLICFMDITDRKLAEAALERSNEELELAYESTLRGWARALELRDAETEGHSQRVTDMTLRMARAAGIAGQELLQVERGALLHDIGKMGIPDSILLKPGPLTGEEWQTMRQHPVLAYEMLKHIDFLRPALEIPLAHHERWDGSGYPHGLAGEDIPLPARLFAVVDVWDALSSTRPYKDPWPMDRVVAYIREGSGTHFDPGAVALFETALAVKAAA